MIPDGKTIRKQLSDAALTAYIHHGYRLYTGNGSSTVHLDWRLPKCEINTHALVPTDGSVNNKVQPTVSELS